MGEVEFTAGITLATGETVTVDVDRIDERGISYRTEEGRGFAPWQQVRAVMLATTDHMLETAGAMLELSEVLRDHRPADAAAMRRRALGLVAEVAPRLCPRGADCPLATDDARG